MANPALEAAMERLRVNGRYGLTPAGRELYLVDLALLVDAGQDGAPSAEVLAIANVEANRMAARIRELEQNANFLRESIGECHMMLSRRADGIRYHLRQDWENMTLPARLLRALTDAGTNRLADVPVLSAERKGDGA